MNLSPAAFGQRIARLEKDLGQSLFKRTTRKVDLTSAGERAVEPARRLVRTSQELQQAILDTETPTPFDLTIATRFELGLSWLTPSLPQLESQRPERILHLSFGDSNDMLQRVARGTVDASITSARALPADVEFEVLHDEEYAFVACQSTGVGRISLRNAVDHVLLDIDSTRPLFDYFLRTQKQSAPWRFRRVDCLGTIGAIRLRALQGAGIAVLPRYFVARDLKQGKLVELDHPGKLLHDAFRLVWRTGHVHHKELSQLAAELRDIPLR